MNHALKLVITSTLATAVACASAQQLSTGHGVSLDDGRMAVLAPPPLKANDELQMAHLQLISLPALIAFNHGTSGRYGPYPLTNNTKVGNTAVPYLMQLCNANQSFTLAAMHSTNTLYGPFSVTNGTLVELPNELLIVVRPQPQLKVEITLPERIKQLPLIGVAPKTPNLLRELYELQAKMVALANRVDLETSDVVMQGVPRVHSRVTGSTFSPVIAPSQRDKQNTINGAEMSAVRYLESLFQRHFRVKSQAADGALRYWFSMPAGDYIFCAMQKYRDGNTRGMNPTHTAIWWSEFTFDGEHPMTLSLNRENSVPWREIFTLERAP